MTTSARPDDVLRGHDATVALGRRLGRTAPTAGGAVLCLSGHLGAGKTTLVKGLAEALGVATADDVTSPTFLRAVRFEASDEDGRDLVHVDAYRMQGVADVVDLGLDEDFAGDALVVVEWPETIVAALPDDRLVVHLGHGGEAYRRVRFEATGPCSAAWLARALAEGGA